MRAIPKHVYRIYNTIDNSNTSSNGNMFGLACMDDWGAPGTESLDEGAKAFACMTWFCNLRMAILLAGFPAQFLLAS